MWTLEDEQALREDLIEKIISKTNEGDCMLSREEYREMVGLEEGEDESEDSDGTDD